MAVNFIGHENTGADWVRFSGKIKFNFTAKQKTSDKASIADCRTDIIMKTQNPEGSSTFYIQYEQWPQNN